MKKLLLVASASMLLLSSFSQAGLYRWVDETGEVHFSDKVPVSASRKAVSKMNKHGVIQKTYDPEAEALAKLEYAATSEKRQRLEAQKKIEQERIAILKKRDDYLLATYENKNEITTSFVNKIKLMKGNATILDTQTHVLENRLSVIEKQHSLVKDEDRKDLLQKKIINITDTISQYKKALVQNKEERITLSKNYKTDLNRYIQLTQ